MDNTPKINHIIIGNCCAVCGVREFDINFPPYCEARTLSDPPYSYTTETGDSSILAQMREEEKLIDEI